jgi:hypothetical protein
MAIVDEDCFVKVCLPHFLVNILSVILMACPDIEKIDWEKLLCISKQVGTRLRKCVEKMILRAAQVFRAKVESTCRIGRWHANRFHREFGKESDRLEVELYKSPSSSWKPQVVQKNRSKQLVGKHIRTLRVGMHLQDVKLTFIALYEAAL